MRLLRVAVMGGGGVGKSAITIRFINGAYVEVYDPTIEDSYRKQFEVDGDPCLLEILDTAGIDQYLSLNDMFIRDSDGFVLVFSLTQKESLAELARTRENISRIKPEGQHVPMVVVGNKLDLEYERELDSAAGAQFARESRCQYIETSARDNLNIVAVFEAVVRQLRKTGHHGRKVKGEGGKKKCVIL